MATSKTSATKKRAASGRSAAAPVADRRTSSKRPAKKVAKPVPSPAKEAKSPKATRATLVRDGFTMPKADFALIATLKARALSAQREAKKSELLRAGLHALADLDAPSLVQVLNRLEPIKTGRPKKGQ